MNLWWNPWKEQGPNKTLAYDHPKETKRHTNLKDELCAVNQDDYTRLGEGDQGSETDMQQLGVLESTTEVVLLRMSAN